MAVIQLFNKDTKFIDILTGCIPGVVVWLFSRWSEGAIGEGDAFVHRWTWYGDRVADGLFCLLYSLPVVCKCRCLSPFRKERRQKNGITLYAFSAVAYLMNYW